MIIFLLELINISVHKTVNESIFFIYFIFHVNLDIHGNATLSELIYLLVLQHYKNF